MEVDVKFDLMERCGEFNVGYGERYDRWYAFQQRSLGRKATALPSDWDPDAEKCDRCKQTEKAHEWPYPYAMTSEGEKLAAFLKEFYGLEPKASVRGPA